MFYCKIHQRMNSSHADHCPACREQLALTDHLLRNRAAAINREVHAQPNDFMMKLSARLRVESEPLMSSWEAVTLSLRGWALTCSAAALLLFAIATTVAISRTPNEDEIFTASSGESISQDVWSGE